MTYFSESIDSAHSNLKKMNILNNPLRLLAILGTLFLFGCVNLSYPWLTDDSNTPKESKGWKLNPKLVLPMNSEDLLGYRKIQRASPLITEQLLIQANAINGIQALRMTPTGFTSKWKLAVPNGVEGSLTIINDRLFFGGSDGFFYSVNVNTGEVLWKVAVKAEIFSQATLSEEGQIFFLAGNNVLFALDAADGHQLWVYSRQDTANMTVRGGSKPALKDGILYTGFSDGSLVALAAKSGAPQWEIQLNKNKKFRDIDSSPWVENDRIYVASYDDKVYCINRKDGSLIWKYEAGGFEAITIDNDNLYLPGSANELLAINKKSGKLVWKLSSLEGVPTQVRAIENDYLAFGESQGKLKIVNKKTGIVAFQFEPGRGVFSAPTYDKGRHMIYFISNESHLYGLEFKEENQKWIPYIL